MSKPIIYLAGPMSGLTFEEANAWRVQATEKLSEFHCLSPMRDKDLLWKALDGRPMSTFADCSDLRCAPKNIKNRDYNDVRQSDAVLVNLIGAKRISVGTMIEVGWASEMGKPIVLCMEKNINPHSNPLLNESATVIADSLDEGIQLTKSLFGY